jgi:hypothetical protein
MAIQTAVNEHAMLAPSTVAGSTGGDFGDSAHPDCVVMEP